MNHSRKLIEIKAGTYVIASFSKTQEIKSPKLVIGIWSKEDIVLENELWRLGSNSTYVLLELRWTRRHIADVSYAIGSENSYTFGEYRRHWCQLPPKVFRDLSTKMSKKIDKPGELNTRLSY